MVANYIYIHLDTISNSALAKGLNITDFVTWVPEKPQNILLLEGNAVEGEFDPHTGLKMIRGREAVTNYFNNQKVKQAVTMKWIDFKDFHFLQELAPMDIAELLYFSHMATQLHSPFFYKLQNNFVYFEKKDGLTKVFYRHLDDFYEILAEKIRQSLYNTINVRKSFFKAATPVGKIPASLVKELKQLFQEGAVLEFRQLRCEDQTYAIPIYIVEDQYKFLDSKNFRSEEQVGEVCYNSLTDSWSIQQEEWDLLPVPR